MSATAALQTSQVNHACTISIEPDPQLPLMKVTDNRSCTIRIVHIAIACFRQLVELLSRIKTFVCFYSQRKVLFLSPTKTESGWEYKNIPWEKDNESSALYVFAHGLRSSPYVWMDYIQEIRKQTHKVHIVAPYILNGGNCTLVDAADPIVALVKHYIAKFPDRPINFIGTSNGGRIISYLETKLDPKEMGRSELSVASIAGVHFGTKLINGLDRCHMVPLTCLRSQASRELMWGSECATQLLTDWQAKQKVWQESQVKVRHLFSITMEDEKILSRESSLPNLKSREVDYQIIVAHNHQSVVSGVRPFVLDWLKTDL